MKKILTIIAFISIFSDESFAQNASTEYPLPSAPQVRWQMYENIMFVHLSPAAWQNREYDNWSTKPDQIKLSKLNTDQWCQVAKSWGAKMILFVAKHAGGYPECIIPFQ